MHKCVCLINLRHCTELIGVQKFVISLMLLLYYSKNIFDVKKGEPKKVQVTERLKSVKSL